MLQRVVDTEIYWEIKAYGRILLLAGIAVYGVGLLLLRAHHEQEEATDE